MDHVVGGPARAAPDLVSDVFRVDRFRGNRFRDAPPQAARPESFAHIVGDADNPVLKCFSCLLDKCVLHRFRLR